jgi:AAA15 family ATPase/GTPase
MPKGGFWSDTFEQLEDLAGSTVSQTGQAIKSVTLGSLQKALEEFTGSASATPKADKGIEKLEKGQAKQQNYTPLDAKKLEEGYKKQDQQKIEDVRQRLWHFFNLEKQEEKEAIEERKREEMERKRKKQMEEEEKKKKEKPTEQQPFVETPKGKERRSIFAPRKVSKRSQAETRADAGKQ